MEAKTEEDDDEAARTLPAASSIELLLSITSAQALSIVKSTADAGSEAGAAITFEDAEGNAAVLPADKLKKKIGLLVSRGVVAGVRVSHAWPKKKKPLVAGVERKREVVRVEKDKENEEYWVRTLAGKIVALTGVVSSDTVSHVKRFISEKEVISSNRGCCSRKMHLCVLETYAHM